MKIFEIKFFPEHIRDAKSSRPRAIVKNWISFDKMDADRNGSFVSEIAADEI